MLPASSSLRSVGASLDGWGSFALTDGTAFVALLRTYGPDAIDTSELAAAGTSEQATLLVLQKAFDVASAHFGAPALLDAADLVAPRDGETVDAKSLQAYVLKLRQVPSPI